jgi:hypothetical protein
VAGVRLAVEVARAPFGRLDARRGALRPVGAVGRGGERGGELGADGGGAATHRV